MQKNERHLCGSMGILLHIAGISLIAFQLVSILIIMSGGGFYLPDFSGSIKRAVSDLGALIGVFLPGCMGIATLIYSGIRNHAGNPEGILPVAFRWMLRLGLMIWVTAVLFPVVWMLYSSLKSPMEFMASPWALPKIWAFSNYVQAWVESSFSRYVINTMMITGGTTVLFFFMLTTTAYILGKYNTRISKFFRIFYFVAMMIPSILILVPLYFQLETLGTGISSLIAALTGKETAFSLTDNRAMLIVIYAVQVIPVPIFLVSGFVRNIDKSFLEAAYIDGAGEWYIFSRIVLPFIRPIVLFQCLAVFMSVWNEYTLAFTFLGFTEKHHTISVGLRHITEIFSRGQEFGTIFAALTISMVPILILYSVFQRQILEGADSSEGLK